MKLELNLNLDGINQIEAYSEGQLIIANKTYETSLILSSTVIMDDWRPSSIADLLPSDLEPLLALSPELILIGTGRKLHFLSDEIIAPLYSRNMGFEVMDTSAACRCFNFLTAEGRQVVAGLLMINKD